MPPFKRPEAEPVQIDWITVLAQIANFLVLVWLLRRFLYAPITRAMAQREQRISDRLASAREARETAEAEAEKLRRQRQEVADSREAKMQEARDKALALRKKLEQDLHEDLESRRRNWRQRLEDERAEFARAVELRAGREITGIVRRVLTEFTDTDLAAQLAAQFVRQLEGLSDEDRARLSEAAEDADQPALVESASQLPPPVRARITNALHETVAPGIEVEYRTSDEIVLGVRLTLGGQTVEWSAGRRLARLETALAEALDAASAPDAGAIRGQGGR